MGTIRKLAHWRETGGGDRSCRETGGGDRSNAIVGTVARLVEALITAASLAPPVGTIGMWALSQKYDCGRYRTVGTIGMWTLSQIGPGKLKLGLEN